MNREWHTYDLVKHFKGNVYRVLFFCKNTENEEDMVAYKLADNTGKIWVRPLKSFNEKVDKHKYPDSKQEYRFELIDRFMEN